MQEALPPKRQAVVDRLRRRIESYRRHQTASEPRYNQSFNGLVERDIQETLLLKQKYLESKAKRTKKPEKKLPPQLDTSQGLHNNSLPKFGTKRHSEDVDGDAFNDPPPTKTVPPPPPPTSQADGPRFSVEIVQQLEFVGSTSNCCTINTNVTVNTSIKSDTTSSSSSSSRKGNVPPDTGQGQTNNCHVGTNHNHLHLVECKQEPDNPEFVDLETCAAALEKDGASLGGLGGLGEFLGDETNGINDAAFKDLISEITDFHPEFMKDFNFDEKPSSKHVTNNNNIHSNHNHTMPPHHFKEEPNNDQQQNCKNGSMSHQQQQYPAFPKSELSPAAQTLKHMAQQHQHKTQQMGINFNPIKQEVFSPNSFNGTNNSNGSVPSPLPNKQSPGPGPGQRPTMNQTPPAGFKQQYSPASPSPSYHHKPGHSPRPPSCPSSQAGSNPGSLIVNQAQSMHISSGQAQNIQVSMAQNVSTDMKPNMISVAAQQGMYYSSPTPSTPSPAVSDPGSCSMSQSQSVNFSHQQGQQPGPGGMRHRTPGPQHQGPSPSPVRHPGGVDPKLLHQQQQHSMMRSQLLQQQQQQQRPKPTGGGSP
uniref:Neurogenic protein mastermind n=1 Tax=Cacopsylla melanoneura TaxID=428564 RepID=A0A8D8V8H0_9HEMI